MTPPATSPELPAATAEPSRRWPPRLLPILRTVWPWLLLGGLVAIGWEEIKQIDLGAVRGLLKATDPAYVLAMLAVTALNLGLGGFYDVLALGSRRKPPGTMARWSIGVVTFAWSNFLTIGPLAGPALRLWLYRPLEVDTPRARGALASILGAFTLGLLVWCGAVSLPLPQPLDGPEGRLGAAFVLGGLAAFAWSRFPFGLRDDAGGSRVRPFALIGVAVADWLLAWVVFHMAVDAVYGDLPVGTTLRVFFLGQLVGLLSFIPGGLGSADVFWALQLTAEPGTHDRVVAALLLYRIVYYVVPFLFATLALAGHLVRTGRRIAVFVRSVVASYAFLCGAVLLVSAASPALRERVDFLRETVPLALVEVSHGVSVALGFLLLVVARGLARGYRSSHHMAIVLFLMGSLSTFVKGLDYEEALLLLAAVALLLVFRRTFDRKGRLAPSAEFLVSTGVFALLLFVAVGIGSYDAFPALGDVMTKFRYGAQEERFSRGLILLAVVAGLVALRLGQRAASSDDLPDADEVDRALDEARLNGRNTSALLVATGDKALFRTSVTSPDYLAYRTAGRFLITYSDPVCRQGREKELLSAFLTFAADRDREVILYQVTPAFLPVAHDFGFTFFKLGEEAIVDLTRWDLKGNKAKTWRNAVNSAEKAGARFATWTPAEVRANLPELKGVSDAWLRRKRTSEKGFSIGRFEAGYMSRFPCAVVLDAAGGVQAFANILEGPRGEEMSVDLMRYLDPVEGGVPNAMEYLFIKLMLEGQARGFARFNLGMAPLASVGELKWSRPIERFARQLFLHGETWYNYQGLRRFKEKFDPSWEPRYMAYPRPWDWPLAITATTMLISGGWKAWISPRSRPA